MWRHCGRGLWKLTNGIIFLQMSIHVDIKSQIWSWLDIPVIFKKISKYGTFAIEIVLLPMLVYNFCTPVIYFYGKGAIFGDFLKITGISNQLHIWDLISTWIDICKKNITS